MVRHIVIWNHGDGFTPEEQRQNAVSVKEKLEALKGDIGGILEFSVIIDPLPTGNGDIMLHSLFESVETLAAYQIHPAHVRASDHVGRLVQGRRCFDHIV